MTLTAALVALPFLLLGGLLVWSTAGDLKRYAQMERVIDGFRTGLDLVAPLETMRDLAPANAFINSPEVAARYDAAHADAGSRLAVFLTAIRAFDNSVLNNSANRIDTAWKELRIEASNSNNPTVPFDNVERFNEEIYNALSALFFVSAMDAGDETNAKELMMLSLDNLRRARQQLGLVRSIGLYTSLRDGYLASTDAAVLDTAWNELNDLGDKLDTDLANVRADDTGPMPGNELAALHDYLAHAEDSLILAQHIGPDWQPGWAESELALVALRNTGNHLLDRAATMVRDERNAKLRLDFFLAVGGILLFAAITTLAVMLYRTRYQAIQAQAENRAKSLFLARMSHEIRTPLNGVIGLAELLADTQPTPRQKEYIDLINTAGRTLSSLINDILDHAKIEAGKLDLEHTPIDIRVLLAESAQVFGLRAGENRTLIFCAVDDDVPTTMIGDPTRIRQVLLNLIGNAVKFTRHGRIEVHAELATGNDGAMRLRVEIRDTGIGLTPAEQQNLFNLFTQASPEVTRRFGGTGLGLSISRELVRLMSGSIGVYSGVGAGSVFWFELPLTTTTLASQRKPEQPSPLPTAVLLVDLEGHITRAASALPDDITRRLTVAASAIDAMRRLEEQPELRFVVINGQQQPEDATQLAQQIVAMHPGLVVRLLVAVGVDARPLLSSQQTVRDVVARSVFAGNQLVQLLIPPDVVAAAVASAPTEPVRSVLPPGLRVLVAEDNPVNQLVTRGMLGKLGIEADVVADGHQAVERYRERDGAYDIVLMDLDMPVLDGNDATREIRKLESSCGWRRCPILALSAHALPEYGVQAREAGMDGQLVKPVTLATLGETLRLHYRKRA